MASARRCRATARWCRATAFLWVSAGLTRVAVSWRVCAYPFERCAPVGEPAAGAAAACVCVSFLTLPLVTGADFVVALGAACGAGVDPVVIGAAGAGAAAWSGV